ncbi:hypothetical protein OENI_120006 [Oenococcus oeni]|nr:hypothetical protein OENI_120006 [Oenococcus oeni]
MADIFIFDVYIPYKSVDRADRFYVFFKKFDQFFKPYYFSHYRSNAFLGFRQENYD